MIKFAHPAYLYFLLIVPFLIGAFILFNYFRNRDIKAFGNPALLQELMPEVSQYRPHVKFYMLMTVLTFIIFAIAGPRFGSKIDNSENYTNVELMLALDISNSMLAEDVSPNRMTKAKQIISQLIDELNGNKFGLVVFAGDAFIQLPITSDLASAKMFMSSISPKLIERQGTDIGAAITLCVRSFSAKEGYERAIVLITDGENHEEGTMEAVKMAAEKDYRIHVVGVGNPNGAPIPIPGTAQYMKDATGKVVVSRLNEKMCQEIAEEGNGIYVRADNSNTAVKILTDELEQMQSDKSEEKRYLEYSEQFQVFAWLALALLLIEFCILARKNKWFAKFKLFD